MLIFKKKEMLAVEKRWIDVEEYHRMAEAGILKLTEKVELIDGEIIRMSPVGSRHASIVDLLTEVLMDLLKKEVIIRVQSPININKRSEPEPDITILKKRKDRYSTSHPKPEDIILIIEVADATFEYDSTTKASLYASGNIQEYWLIDLNKDRIEVYQNPAGEEYLNKKIVRKSDELSILKDVFKVAAIFS